MNQMFEDELSILSYDLTNFVDSLIEIYNFIESQNVFMEVSLTDETIGDFPIEPTPSTDEVWISVDGSVLPNDISQLKPSFTEYLTSSVDNNFMDGNQAEGLTHILYGISLANSEKFMTCLTDFGASVTTVLDGNPNIIHIDITDKLPEPHVTTVSSTQPPATTSTTKMHETDFKDKTKSTADPKLSTTTKRSILPVDKVTLKQ